MHSPLIDKLKNEDIQAWGDFHLVITDDLTFPGKVGQALGVTDVVDLEDYVPIIKPEYPKVAKLHRTHLFQGISLSRKEHIPFVGYVYLRPNEIEYLSRPEVAITPFHRSNQLRQIRAYPVNFNFLSVSEVHFLKGKVDVVRYRAEHLADLMEQLNKV